MVRKDSIYFHLPLFSLEKPLNYSTVDSDFK